MSNNRSALFLGATGAVGKALLIDLLKSGNYKTITTIGRREFEYNGPNKEALIQKVVSFEKLDDHKEAFTGFIRYRILYIRQQNPSEDLHFLYCSSAGANPKSSFLYMKTKGEIEQELTEIGKAIVHVDVVGRAMRKVATEEVEFEDYEITLADNGTLIETANHKKIHEIAS
ncbi:unnamed protein product [Rhizophagus irregularis]|nr:unnamed protein product [Rhizophagus irregularis]